MSVAWELRTMDYRIYVEKKEQFRVEAQSLQRELNVNLQLSIENMRLVNVYDLFGFTPQLLDQTRYGVFGEVVTDNVTDSIDLSDVSYVAIESLPGQFDQRAASAVDCVKLVAPDADVDIRCARLLIFNEKFNDETLNRIKHYTINTVECREKNMEILGIPENAATEEVKVLTGFRNMTESELAPYCKANGLAMNADDLRCVVDYFKQEGRDPYHTELVILDTYWSDHCRHTTFTTVLTEITVDESFMKAEMEESLALYERMRQELGRQNKDRCLMDLATIGAKYLKKHGYLDDIEQSEENNACSIFVNIKVDGELQRWLLQFKNETHNHPTEIEPFGGASTCLGGAIRDPLSGRAYVYQAMRVSGAGNIYAPVADTMKGKLPQRVISTKAAAGYSSYGNQIGLATTHLREIYHPDYVAKRMEVGAVVGAVKADAVRRERPCPGDVVMMFGGRTGRDGVGGATGSSKEHDVRSLETCSSEVQKGNAPEERKLERLFRRPEVTKLVKKSNDFGAGGVSVAIGELTDGLDIYLDRVKTKYSGLNATELAISESQERLSVVIEAKDEDLFRQYCASENLEVIHVADVTDTARMRMFYHGKTIVDLSRDFIDSAGAPHYTKANIGAVDDVNPMRRFVEGKCLSEKFVNNLIDDNVQTQKGLIEMFDATIGRSTVLMPYGGTTQRSETQVSVQKLPVDGYTDDASIMAYGFNPYISKWSPYHGAAYAVVEACAKVVAAGGRYNKMRFSYQEYFERMATENAWGKPLSALLGALRMQEELKLPSIGGKDSMSGTFQDINVPPTLIAFGIAMVDAANVISTDFKQAGNYIYLLRHTPRANYMPDTACLRRHFDAYASMVEHKQINSAYAVGMGGVAEAIAKMAFGSAVGCNVEADEQTLFDYSYGSIVFTSPEKIDDNELDLVLLGQTTTDNHVVLNGIRMSIEELYHANSSKFATIYPDKSVAICKQPIKAEPKERFTAEYPGAAVEHPRVFIPVFPGTNCDYDLAKAFRTAGADVHTAVFCNLTAEDVAKSIRIMCDEIAKCHILALAGGFSSGDEPDGSAKFIATVLNNVDVARQIHALIDRKCLILGICNGFQALVKSGLLPYGRLGCLTNESPTLFRNDINRHISQLATTQVSSISSPWLAGFKFGELHDVAFSHGEGKFVVNDELAKQLFENGQVAFQYVDASGSVTMQSPFNPNGSSHAIEGVISKDGLILGKMGHSERYEKNIFRNIYGQRRQPLFDNAVAYFRKK